MSRPRPSEICLTDGCGAKAYVRAMCRRHYSRERRHGDASLGRPANGRALLDRIRERLVRTSSGCLEWTGTRDRHGYGRLNVDGIPKLVHRLLWELTEGPIPEGLEPDHVCRNTSCALREHLELVTHAENIRRAHASKRERLTA